MADGPDVDEVLPARRIAAGVALVGVTLAYIVGVLIVTVVDARAGVWWPAVLAFLGLVALVVAALWTWLEESRQVAAQSVAIATLMLVSAAGFVLGFDRGQPFGVMSLVALVVGAVAASAFLASARAPTIADRPTRFALAAACLLLAQHLAVLPPLEWFLPVGTWGLAAVVFVVRATLTHDPMRVPGTEPDEAAGDPSASNL